MSKHYKTIEKRRKWSLAALLELMPKEIEVEGKILGLIKKGE